MNKTTIIIAAVILLGGAIYLMSQTTPTQDDTAILKEAFLGTGSVVCTFVDPGAVQENGEQVTAYIKSGSMRFFADEIPDFQGDIIFKDNTYYFWEGQEGIKMSLQEEDIEEDTLIPFMVRDDEVVVKIPNTNLIAKEHLLTTICLIFQRM